MILELCIVIYYSIVASTVNIRKCMTGDLESDSESESDDEYTNFQDLSRIAMNDSRYESNFKSIYENDIY